MEGVYKTEAWNPSPSALLRAVSKMIRLQAVEIQEHAQKQIDRGRDLIREANELANLAADLDRGKTSDFKVDQQTKDRPKTESGEVKQTPGKSILPDSVAEDQEQTEDEQKGDSIDPCDH